MALRVGMSETTLSETLEKHRNLQVHSDYRRWHLTLVGTAEVLLFVAFLLSLLVSVSLPIVKPVYLLRVSSNTSDLVPSPIATELRFGVWGFCATR